MHAPSNTVKTNKMKFLQGALLSALDSSVLNHLFFFHFQKYKCFGIQFYGECWSGKDACNNFEIHGTADNCLCSGNGYKPYDPKRGYDCVEPVGGKLSNFVYEIEVNSGTFLKRPSLRSTL